MYALMSGASARGRGDTGALISDAQVAETSYTLRLSRVRGTRLVVQSLCNLGLVGRGQL